MKKILIFGIFALACGIFGGYFYYKNSQNTKVLKDYNLEPLTCDLAKNPCSAEGVRFDISPRPIIVMGKSTITLSNLPNDIDDPKIRIHGLNMDMGTIIASLNPLNNPLKAESSSNEPESNINKKRDFSAQVALSACVIENVMRYRISLYNGNEPTKIFADFDLER